MPPPPPPPCFSFLFFFRFLRNQTVLGLEQCTEGMARDRVARGERSEVWIRLRPKKVNLIGNDLLWLGDSNCVSFGVLCFAEVDCFVPSSLFCFVAFVDIVRMVDKCAYDCGGGGGYLKYFDIAVKIAVTDCFLKSRGLGCCVCTRID